jgi:hypothetical protein
MIEEQSVPKKGSVYKLTIIETSTLTTMNIVLDKCNQSFISFGIPTGNYANGTLALLKGLDRFAPCL